MLGQNEMVKISYILSMRRNIHTYNKQIEPLLKENTQNELNEFQKMMKYCTMYVIYGQKYTLKSVNS